MAVGVGATTPIDKERHSPTVRRNDHDGGCHDTNQPCHVGVVRRWRSWRKLPLPSSSHFDQSSTRFLDRHFLPLLLCARIGNEDGSRASSSQRWRRWGWPPPLPSLASNVTKVRSQREAGTRQRNCCVHTLPVPPACPPKIHKPLTIISTVLPKSNPIPPKSAGYCSSLPTKNASKPTPPAAARRGGRTLSLSAPPQHCEATRRLLVANLRLPPLHADHKHVADDDFTSSSYLGTAGKGYALLVGPAAYPRRHVRSYTPAARGGPLALLVTALDEGLGSIHLVATNTTTASGALTDQLVDDLVHYGKCSSAASFSSSLKGWIPAIFPCSTSPAFQSTRPSASPGNVKEHH
ncbi:Os04g0664250 [Oryza sativa Japonica Group]|uniref:Os04g0664250 protein n=1 Tax=Oryza sativa subsp. japonica TaxID=39947 RepID=A0A0P0WFZ6_ORYSJ|nr:Os04g0664250 [Oryza sativa Japonica Group]